MLLILGLQACDGDGTGVEQDAGQDGALDAGQDAGQDAGADAGADAGSPYDFTGLSAEWILCDMHDGSGLLDAECATVAMPRHWDSPEDGETFKVAFKRRRVPGGATAQLWFLQGGPGASGTMGLPWLMEALQADLPDFDVYTIDPRGAGRSEYLGCPEQEDPDSEGGAAITGGEMDACIATLQETHGADLALFNATNAAIDLAAGIQLTRGVDQPVFIWGGSGGTYWGQRFLQLFPDMADGMILEGIAPPDNSLIFQDEYIEKTAWAVLDACAADADCGQRIPDPRAFVAQLYEKLEQGHCGQLQVSPATVKYFMWKLCYYRPHAGTIPAFLYRLDRCTAADMQAIVHYYNTLFTADVAGMTSYALFYNEVFSELWDHPSFDSVEDMDAYLDEVHESTVLAYDVGHGRHNLYKRWPKYDEPLQNIYAETEVPLLMLQGVLDPSTPYDFARGREEHFTGAHQHFVAFPWACHNVVSGSPVSADPEARTCAKQLWMDFVRDPTGALDTSCVDQALPFDFAGTNYGAYFFGTEDYWSETPASKGAARQLPLELRSLEAQLADALRQGLPELARKYGSRD